MQDELIEIVARAICAERDGEDAGEIITSVYDRQLAQAAIAALSAHMVPVAWRYERGDKVRYGEERSEEMTPAWTETPLYALPALPEDG